MKIVNISMWHRNKGLRSGLDSVFKVVVSFAEHITNTMLMSIIVTISASHRVVAADFHCRMFKCRDEQTKAKTTFRQSDVSSIFRRFAATVKHDTTKPTEPLTAAASAMPRQHKHRSQQIHRLFCAKIVGIDTYSRNLRHCFTQTPLETNSERTNLLLGPSHSRVDIMTALITVRENTHFVPTRKLRHFLLNVCLAFSEIFLAIFEYSDWIWILL